MSDGLTVWHMIWTASSLLIAASKARRLTSFSHIRRFRYHMIVCFMVYDCDQVPSQHSCFDAFPFLFLCHMALFRNNLNSKGIWRGSGSVSWFQTVQSRFVSHWISRRTRKLPLICGGVYRYTQALQLDPTSAVLLSNRAFCHFKLENYGLCLSDANDAITQDPKYVKVGLCQ